MIAERLKYMRMLRGFTQKKLAEEARGVSERTISRLEKGEVSSPRQVTVSRLAEALTIARGVLTGEDPLPHKPLPQPDVTAEKTQFNVRVNAAIRNAYELAARRYGVSTTKIVQLAPLLFIIAAEESLKYRREKLKEWEAELDRRDELESQLSYLPTAFNPTNPHDLVSAEMRSIEKPDLFGECLLEICDYDWFEAQSNPFEAYLRTKATEKDVQKKFAAEVRAKVLAVKPSASEGDISATIAKIAGEERGRVWLAEIHEQFIKMGTGDVSVNAIGPTSTEYKICRTEAMDLVGSDFDAAESLLDGRVTIDRTFRGLKTPEERIAWIRENSSSSSVVVVEEEPRDQSSEDIWPQTEGVVIDLDLLDLDIHL